MCWPPGRNVSFHFQNPHPGLLLSSGHLKQRIGTWNDSIKKSGLTIHKLIYDEHLVQYSNALKIARTEYYSQIINDGIAKPNKMFKVINKLLKPTNSLICYSSRTGYFFINPIKPTASLF